MKSRLDRIFDRKGLREIRNGEGKQTDLWKEREMNELKMFFVKRNVNLERSNETARRV